MSGGVRSILALGSNLGESRDTLSLAVAARAEGGDPLGAGTVVRGVGEVVGRGGRADVGVQQDVDHEGLPVALLVVEHAVVPGRRDPGDRDGVPGSIRPRRHAQTPSMAIRLP